MFQSARHVVDDFGMLGLRQFAAAVGSKPIPLERLIGPLPANPGWVGRDAKQAAMQGRRGAFFPSGASWKFSKFGQVIG